MRNRRPRYNYSNGDAILKWPFENFSIYHLTYIILAFSTKVTSKFWSKIVSITHLEPRSYQRSRIKDTIKILIFAFRGAKVHGKLANDTDIERTQIINRMKLTKVKQKNSPRKISPLTLNQSDSLSRSQ